MKEWKPNHSLIDRLEVYYKKIGCEDQQIGVDHSGRTVRYLIDIFESDNGDFSEQLEYLRQFDPNQPFEQSTYNGRDVIDHMRRGTPEGVLFYFATIPHLECCIDVEHEHTG